MDAPETVTDAVRSLEALGYTATLRSDGSLLHCDACGSTHEPERLVVTHTFRFEGPSDPADEAIVLGVQCPRCGARAVVVSAYGPEADPALFQVIARLTD